MNYTLNWHKNLEVLLVEKGNGYIKKDIMDMWFRVVVAILPAAIIGIPFDDLFEEHFHNYIVVALALIVYGILFIIIERKNKNADLASYF